jgi:CRP-like cAMP-binding protein
LLSTKTIKGKLAQYFMEQVKPGETSFTLSKNQTQLAEYFGVARPSLARSLSEMATDGLVEIDKKQVTILDFNGLKELLA